MNFNRLRELSGLKEVYETPQEIPEEQPTDEVPPATDVAPVEPTPAEQTPSQRLDQIIVVMDVPAGSKTAVTDMSVDDVMTVCSPAELVNLIKGCDKECNYSLYPLSARAEAETDALRRLSDHEQVMNYEDTEGAQASLENDAASKTEWDNPVSPGVKESVEEPKLPKEYNVRVKSLIKDLEDCVAAHEVRYKHSYMEDQLDDAGTNLKMLEVCMKLKHFLTDGKVNQATTYYTSLTNIYQDKIPVSVRKFLQHGGQDHKHLKDYFKVKGE